MDSFDEKKWFVYLGDHHEGPFSVQEIQGRMAEGMVSSANYVWCEGMGDWQLMSEVGAFSALAQPAFQQAAGDGFAVAAAGGAMGGSAASYFSQPEPALQQPSVEAAPVETLSQLAEAFPASVSPIEPVAEPALEMPASAAPVTVMGGDMTAPAVALEPAQPSLATIPKSFEQTGTGPVSRAQIAAATSLELQTVPEQAPQGGARPMIGDEMPAARLWIARILRALKPIAFLAVISGVVFAYTAGYLDPLLASPGMRAFTSTVADFSRPYLIKLAEKAPILQKVISPIPRLDDVPEAQYEELRKAAMSGPENGGSRLAMALSNDGAAGPVFYTAAKLPDGTKLEIRIVGVSDTLLNQLSSSASESFTLSKRFAKSAPIRALDGKPVPKGQYTAYLIESSDDSPVSKAALAGVASAAPLAGTPAPPPDMLPKDAKLLATGSYFLGGPKDAVYDTRLKEFHAKLSARAVDELHELHQFADTLQSQLDDSTRKFAEIKKSFRGGKVPPAKRKDWDAFDQRWMQLSGSLDQTFAKWTNAMLDQDYFYGVLYQLTQQAGQAVDFEHKTQQAYLLPTADRKVLEGQLTQADALAATTLGNLRAKIDQAEKIPPSANGMPRREGL